MAEFERRTDRVTLRLVREQDLDWFVSLEASLRASEDPPRDSSGQGKLREILYDFIAVWRRGELGYWTVHFGGEIAGFGRVQPRLWGDRRCWNLYYRVRPDLWGIATEVAREAVAAGRQTRAWPVLVETRRSNYAAIKVANEPD